MMSLRNLAHYCLRLPRRSFLYLHRKRYSIRGTKLDIKLFEVNTGPHEISIRRTWYGFTMVVLLLVQHIFFGASLQNHKVYVQFPEIRNGGHVFQPTAKTGG